MPRRAPNRAPSPPPDWITAEAAEVWARTAPRVPKADPDTLVVYCCAVAEFNRAQEMLDRTGPLVAGQKGNLVANPLLRTKTANAGVIRQAARDLGLPESAAGDRPGGYRNQSATERTIAALRQTGKIEAVDEATLALVRTVAAALDRLDPEDAPAPIASLARVQLAALRMLRGQDDDTDSLTALLASLSSAVGDAEES
jgi:P27 family predicted phage terminase small subunit